MTNEIEEAAMSKAAEKKAEARLIKTEAKSKKKALRKAKRATRSAERQKAIDAARATGYTGHIILLNPEPIMYEEGPYADAYESVDEDIVEKANREALEADAERRRYKQEAKRKHKATKKAAKSVRKMEKQRALDAIRETGWSRPVVLFNQQKLFNVKSKSKR